VSKSHDHLTRREREIVNTVFALGNRATLDAIRQRLTDPPSVSAVRVMLARLERGGVLTHTQDGVRHVFSVTTSPEAAKRTALKQYLQTFFGGSVRQLVTSLVRDDSWSDEELRELKSEIDQIRKQRKRQ
jgi:BlaI family penicillinase repressor